jgi:hypothetical protein
MPVATQPIDLLTAKSLLPTELRTGELSRLDQWTRERSFYMATVTQAEILQEMRGMVARAARGEAGEYELRKEWEAYLDKIGYQPLPGQAGTIKDLRSLRRFNVALRTNLRLMRGWALKENGRSRGELLSAPGWELVRIRDAKVPREWLDRFVEVGGEIKEGRMIAPKLDDVWQSLGNRAFFDDALGVDYPPFAWSSGMSWKPVYASEMERLGYLTPAEIKELAKTFGPVAMSSPNESLQTTPSVTDTDLRDAVAEQLDGLARWVDDKLVFTDPNGTRPVELDELQVMWSKPLPVKFRTEEHPSGLFQRDAVLDFGDDPETFAKRPATDAWEDLARAVGRVTDDEQRRRILTTIADREDTTWIARAVESPAWGRAMNQMNLPGRAVGLLKAIRDLML